jgi:signal transduction histidine kinase
VKLAEFILDEMETILQSWEVFARSLPGGASMDVAALRDHARQILEAVCKDIVLEQTREAEITKSHGRAVPLNAEVTAAQTHALMRARIGFDINAMASEYRALRACVLRLWLDRCAPALPDLPDVIRFNEAIDQALAESISHFSSEVDRARNLLLGILGHDLRTPLSAIQMTAHHLRKLNAGAEVSVAAERLIRNGSQMKGLLDDLTAFNRKQLGLGINVNPADTDLGEVFAEQLQQLRTAYPAREVTLEVHGDLRGKWDPVRIQQIVGNLVVNAIRYGAPKRPIHVVLSGLEDEVLFSVENEGEAIPPSALAQMFDPLKRGANQPDIEGSLGLGLYICREITLAHGGSISAQSTGARTQFDVRLPRTPLDPAQCALPVQVSPSGGAV